MEFGESHPEERWLSSTGTIIFLSWVILAFEKGAFCPGGLSGMECPRNSFALQVAPPGLHHFDPTFSSEMKQKCGRSWAFKGNLRFFERGA
jgi:hypothetical protein